MTALLEWLDAPTEMVKAESQAAGPRPTDKELEWMFRNAGAKKKERPRVGETPPKTRGSIDLAARLGQHAGCYLLFCPLLFWSVGARLGRKD